MIFFLFLRNSVKGLDLESVLDLVFPLRFLFCLFVNLNYDGGFVCSFVGFLFVQVVLAPNTSSL